MLRSAMMLGVWVAGLFCLAEPARAEPAKLPMATLKIEIVAPPEAASGGPFEVVVRVFEAEDPDAPPQVTTIAMKTLNVETLSPPLNAEIEFEAARLAGTLRPAVGVIVSAGGRMVYWTAAFVPVERSGPTTVRLDPIP